MSDALDTALAHFEIQQAIYRYCRALDRLDAQLLTSAFHPEAHIDLGAIYRGGVSGFVPVAMAFMGEMLVTRHDVSNIMIESLEDGYGCEAYVQAWHRLVTPEGEQELLVMPRYLCRFARHEGAWRIIHHAEVVDWGRLGPTSAAWYESNTELPKGVRNRADSSYRILGSQGESGVVRAES